MHHTIYQGWCAKYASNMKLLKDNAKKLDKTNIWRHHMEGTHKITGDSKVLYKETIPEINT